MLRIELGSLLRSLAAGAFAGALGALCIWFALVHIGGYGPSDPADFDRTAPSKTPGLDIVDRTTCQRWQRRIVLVNGVEDGFARGGNEPARIDPRLLDNGLFRDLAEGKNRVTVLRNYDEPGADKYFTDWFDMPRGIESAQLIVRARGEPGADNDNVRVGDLFDDPDGEARFGTTEFGSRLKDIGNRKTLPDGSILLTLDLAQLPKSLALGSSERFVDWANSAARPDRLEVAIGDDTSVDFMALVLCMAPDEMRGVTTREFHNKSIGEDLSWLRCNGDFSQPGCDPYSGDMSCAVALPLGCFKPGSRSPDIARLKQLELPLDSFNGGEVRMTAPVAGKNFPTVASANAYCSAKFGAGWRVLSYHEGGGGGLISYSRIPPKSRMWIDIVDQPRANCWDRDRVRSR